jgi:hypothetical protein
MAARFIAEVIDDIRRNAFFCIIPILKPFFPKKMSQKIGITCPDATFIIRTPGGIYTHVGAEYLIGF